MKDSKNYYSGGRIMDSKKLNELLRAFKSGDYKKLQEVKNMVSEEDYQKAMELFNQYSNVSEEEALAELSRLKHAVPNHEEMVDRIRPLLNKEQLAKLDRVMDYLNSQD